MQGLMPSLGKGVFLSEDMFGGTLQGEVDQNTVATLASTVSPIGLLDQRISENCGAL